LPPAGRQMVVSYVLINLVASQDCVGIQIG